MPLRGSLFSGLCALTFIAVPPAPTAADDAPRPGGGAASELFLEGLTGEASRVRNPIGAPGLKPVYTSGFLQGDELAEWSENHRTVGTTPSRHRFLGPFGPDFVSLELSSLPPHKLLAVSFDLYAIKSWDGNLHPFGPDVWEMSLLDGPVLVHTTFSNWGGRQENYPDNYPGPVHRVGQRAAVRNSLGYRGARGDNDAVYRVFAICPHSAPHLKLRMIGRHYDANPRDQSWGVANFSIFVADELNPLDPKQLEDNWGKLSDTDPMTAVNAMWTLASAGDRAVELIAAKLETERGGPGSAYTNGGSAASWRLRRARRALRVIDSPAAKRLLWRLDEPGRFPSDAERYAYSRGGR